MENGWPDTSKGSLAKTDVAERNANSESSGANGTAREVCKSQDPPQHEDIDIAMHIFDDSIMIRPVNEGFRFATNNTTPFPPDPREGFRFAERPPGTTKGGVSIGPERVGGFESGSRARRETGINAEKDILTQIWTREYIASPEFGDIWMQIENRETPWPRGFQLHEGKLYQDNLLCIPEMFVERVIVAHHIHMAHCGARKLITEIKRQYRIPVSRNVEKIVQKVRKNCLVCQACDPPNFNMEGPIRFNTVVERFMSSVCLDIFSMPMVEWKDEKYDSFVLCVDRHSGWMIARPTLKDGLTGEKTAHLLIDGGWGEMGIPSQVTSDRGSQFIGQWWATMCSRMGIRMAYAQAYRPQSNGRAETAGITLQRILQAMQAEHGGLNWVEALPRAIMVRHDMVDPELGLSPYEVVFGRERHQAGLPYQNNRECPDAEEFFVHMEKIDKIVADFWKESHKKTEERVNARRRDL